MNLGDHQRLPGYCILLYSGEANHLTDLESEEQSLFLQDMARLGQAVSDACRELDKGFWRINYEILGNKYEHLHAHVRARYHWELEPLKNGSVYRYSDLYESKFQTTDDHEYLRSAIENHLRVDAQS